MKEIKYLHIIISSSSSGTIINYGSGSDFLTGSGSTSQKVTFRFHNAAWSVNWRGLSWRLTGQRRRTWPPPSGAAPRFTILISRPSSSGKNQEKLIGYKSVFWIRSRVQLGIPVFRNRISMGLQDGEP